MVELNEPIKFKNKTDYHNIDTRLCIYDRLNKDNCYFAIKLQVFGHEIVSNGNGNGNGNGKGNAIDIVFVRTGYPSIIFNVINTNHYKEILTKKYI